MKKRNIISVIAITIAIGMGATAYAASADNSQPVPQGQRLGLGRITSMRGYDYIKNVLKSKLGLSEETITNEINEGKTPYEIATEKGLTQEDLKASLLEEKSKAIDAAVGKGTITQAEGEALKANLNTNMQNCTGNFGQGQGACQGQGRGQGQGQGRGMMGNGQGRFR
jgi:hypothetical protein